MDIAQEGQHVQHWYHKVLRLGSPANELRAAFSTKNGKVELVLDCTQYSIARLSTRLLRSGCTEHVLSLFVFILFIHCYCDLCVVRLLVVC